MTVREQARESLVLLLAWTEKAGEADVRFPGLGSVYPKRNIAFRVALNALVTELVRVNPTNRPHTKAERIAALNAAIRSLDEGAR